MPLIHRTSPYPHWEFSDASSGDQLRVVPERGGLVSGWRCGGRELLYLDQERFLDPALSVRGGIPVLFPICGGLPGNRLPLPQGTFQLPQHGFARDLPWQLAPLEDGRGLRMTLSHTDQTLKAFPFAFLLHLEVRLAASALELTVQVENTGEDPMPFSVGLHPYFAVSGLGAISFEGLPGRCFDHHTMAESSTDEQLSRLEMGVDLLVHPTGAVRLLDPKAGLSLELDAAPPFDLVVLWSDPPRPMVCLEPWTGPRQALISGDRKLVLDPGERCDLHCRYVCRAIDAGSDH